MYNCGVRNLTKFTNFNILIIYLWFTVTFHTYLPVSLLRLRVIVLIFLFCKYYHILIIFVYLLFLLFKIYTRIFMTILQTEFLWINRYYFLIRDIYLFIILRVDYLYILTCYLYISNFNYPYPTGLQNMHIFFTT